ncbi:hypothetical protein OEG86_23275 [Hoeflea alexandrii]|uniref:hypothetical protein n=1 Tax=Hoeflea alexandrii TaxID=288436 RepID=UPI0022719FED|nr:hypothetical protein [Hoeflea alexandrii]MCY0154660.1 hypothetical protein [Hoeflea alexandrii]
MIVAGLVHVFGRRQRSRFAAAIHRFDDAADKVAIVIEPDGSEIRRRRTKPLGVRGGRRGARLLDPRLGDRRAGISTLIAGLLKLLEAELVVLLHLAHLLLHLQELESQLLDAAIQSADLLLELSDPEHRISALRQDHRRAERLRSIDGRRLAPVLVAKRRKAAVQHSRDMQVR